MGFWWTLFLVNIGFFLPFYLINIKSQANPFVFMFHPSLNFENRIKAIYYKDSSDPFRCFYEYTALVIVAKLFLPNTLVVVAMTSLFGLIGWITILYSAVMQYVFNRTPLFESDLDFIKIGWQMNYNYRYQIVASLVTVIGLGGYLIAFVTTHLFSLEAGKYTLLFVLLVLTVLAFVKVFKIAYQRFINRTVLSVFVFLYRNIKYTDQYSFLMNKNEAHFKALNLYDDLELSEFPNIYYISVESYGSIVFKNEAINQPIFDVCKRFEHQLKTSGFSIASAFSEAPIAGGGSWKSYTSFTYGIKIADDRLYNILFKSTPNFAAYDSIFHLLKKQGYTNYLLCPATNYVEGRVDWDLVKSNLQSDVFLDWEALDYSGKKILLMGNCYAPPDQYSLYKAQEILDERDDKGQFLFFNTQNSHYPFLSPTSLANDYRDLQDPDFDLQVLTKNRNLLDQRYVSSISYQLESIFKFINDQKNGIFVLFGDHQPPRVAGKGDGFDTPVHIITKNKQLSQCFIDEGFTNGLVPKEAGKRIKHEGFYSLFMKGMYKTFQKSGHRSKKYQENGLKL